MNESTTALISQLGSLSYIGIFITSFLANVVVPVPEEVVLIIFGYLSKVHTSLSLVYLVPIVICGVLLSDIIMYSLARSNNRLVTFFYNKLFSHLFSPESSQWVGQNIKKIIFFSRFMIQFRFLGPFFAGQQKTPFKTFLLYDLLAVSFYVPLYIIIGRFFYKKLNLIIYNVNIVKNIVLVVFVGILVFSLTKILYRFLFKNASQKPVK